CIARLPHTPPPSDEEFLGIRAYDMWKMLLEFEWRSETYGPSGLPRLPTLPQFDLIFKQYGDWIAFKVDRLVTEVAFAGRSHDELVYVCPAEPAMQQLISRLKPRRDDRSVAVQIPRDVLDRLKEGDETVVDLDAADGWARQLRLLAEQDEP